MRLIDADEFTVFLNRLPGETLFSINEFKYILNRAPTFVDSELAHDAFEERKERITDKAKEHGFGMNWTKLLHFASYYGLSFNFVYNKNWGEISATVGFRDGTCSYHNVRSIDRAEFDAQDENGKAQMIHDLLTDLAKTFEVEAKAQQLI